MKIIFLDIDGVLNTGIYSLHFFEVCKHFELTKKQAKDIRHGARDEFGSHFDPRPVNLLKYIIEKTDAKIVVSSTWRMSGKGFIERMWEMRDLPGEILDITPCYNECKRGEEIDEWLKENQVDAYVIIDDNSDMLPEQYANFVQTDSEYGITFKDAEKCIDILNRNLINREN